MNDTENKTENTADAPAEKPGKDPEENPVKNPGNNPGKKPFLYSRIYDYSEVREAEKTAYDEDMDAEELKKRRIRDWIFILLGVPALIGLVYLIVLISR